MKNYRNIIFTAGRGPVECGLAVHGVQLRFKGFLESQNWPYCITFQKLGQIPYSMDTIVFKILDKDKVQLDNWFGTIQWICKSPIRKYSKRKNWYIKCFEAFLCEENPISLSDLKIQAYKASGPGGQHRNKVETAIRIIHKPSGLIVTASDSRSKNQNKKNALEKLNRRLRQEQEKKQVNFAIEQWSSKIEIERGNPSMVFEGLKFKLK